jgi:hypothetical protein
MSRGWAGGFGAALLIGLPKHEHGEGTDKSEQCFVCPVTFAVPVPHSKSVSGGPAVAHRNAAFGVENDSRFAAASIVKDDQL